MTIQELNDQLRKTLSGGKVTLTYGASVQGEQSIHAILKAVQAFDSFTEDNDPYGEHDFGAFEVDAVRYFWKIDYYDNNMEYLSPDPSNPEVTKRVLTIMRAEEY